MKEITLKRHQQEVVDWDDPKFAHLDPFRFGLFFAPRVGKTYVLLALCEKYKVDALIIVPKGIKKQWQEYVKGTGHLVVTKEEFRRDYKILRKFEAFIFDEAHHASNPKSQLTKACYYYMKKHNPMYRWLATGTPYRSSPMNIFGLGKLLGMDWDYWKFFNQFYVMVPMGGRSVPVLKNNMEAKLEGYVRSMGITLLLEDVEEIETLPPEALRIDFDLTASQIAAIESIEVATPIARFTKIHAIEQGYVPGDEYIAAQDLECLKTRWIFDRVAIMNRVVVVCRFTHQIELYEEYFIGFNRKVLVIDGHQKRTASEIAEEFRTYENAIIIVQAACCEGYDLSTADDMIFASQSYSHSDHIQIKDRIVNMNKPKVNRYYYLIGGIVDAGVYASVMDKKDFHMQIFAKQII